MRLVPSQSPGRGTRKARDFGTEIAQLRVQGYTLEAIRSALADAGVHVTRSTVWREANRAAALDAVKPTAKGVGTSGLAPSNDAVPTVASATTSPVATQDRAARRSGAEVAEVFMRTQITNPLIRAKEKR